VCDLPTKTLALEQE